MDLPVTPPRERQSSLRQVHRHRQDARNYTFPPKMPMWRSEPQALPTANTSRKRGRDNWIPPTPKSLPRRKRAQNDAGLLAEPASGNGNNIVEKNWSAGAKTGNFHSVTIDEALVPGHSLVEEKLIYLGFIQYWDEDVMGVYCPFCLMTEIHLMRPPIDEKDPFPNPIWHQDMRAADCQPDMCFRLLFPFDRLAMEGLGWQWVQENARWETSGLEDIVFKEVDEESGIEEDSQGRTAEGPIRSRDRDCSEQVHEDMTEHHGLIPSRTRLTLMADIGPDPPLPFPPRNSIHNETGANVTTGILLESTILCGNAPPEYLTFQHEKTSVVYGPLATIPTLGSEFKTVGFLAPLPLSAGQPVFTRSGWTGETFNETDIARLQQTLGSGHGGTWQSFSILNNREYTDKVREWSASLGLEPKYHNYDNERPLGQVFFSHVEKHLVVVAIEECQSSGLLAPAEPLIHRTIHLDRKPCPNCEEFAKAVEEVSNLRFTFKVMTRVARCRVTNLRPNVETRANAMWKGKDKSSMDSFTDDSDATIISRGSPLPKRIRKGLPRTRRPSDQKNNGNVEYEVEMIIGKKQSEQHGLQYLVRWRDTWLSDLQLEVQLEASLEDLEVVREATRKGRRTQYLVRWSDSWESHSSLANSTKLIEEFERELLERGEL